MDLQPFYSGADRLQEYNPYHGKGGRFTSKGGAVQTVAYAGKGPGGIKPGRAAKLAAAAAKAGYGSRESPLMRQDAVARAKKANDWDGGDGLAASKMGQHLARSARGSGLTKTERRSDARAARSEINAARRSRGQKRLYKAAPKKGDLLLGRETVPQNPKKFVKRTSSGQRPSPEARKAMSVARRGQDVTLKQDTAARKAAGKAIPRTRSAVRNELGLIGKKREGVAQDPMKFTTGKKRTYAGKKG